MSCKFSVWIVLSALAFHSGIQEAQGQKPIGHAKAATHVHPARGPHGGELLEIGKEEYHVELVIDEAKKQMVIYLLDKDAVSVIAIDAPYLAVNLMLSGKPVQFKLKAVPQDVDSKNLASSFGAISPELVDALHSTKSDPRLSVRIHNKSYVTKIVHKHDHAGHNHSQPLIPGPHPRPFSPKYRGEGSKNPFGCSEKLDDQKTDLEPEP